MAERLRDFRQLNIWQKAHTLVLEIYELTKKFPKEDKQELSSKLRQDAMTIPIKIAEGFMRRNPRDKLNIYGTGQEALEALRYTLILAGDLKYIKDNEEILLSVEEVSRMLSGLIRSAKG